jgi:hypothetical protein
MFKRLTKKELEELKDMEGTDALHYLFYDANGRYPLVNEIKYVIIRGGFRSTMDDGFYTTMVEPYGFVGDDYDPEIISGIMKKLTNNSKFVPQHDAWRFRQG